jgi:hypothetical protein
MTWAIGLLRKLVFALLLPLILSALTIYVVRALLHVGFIYDDGSGVMTRVTGVVTDMSLQAAYFATLTAVTKDYRYTFVLFAYQIIIAFMFFRYGSPTLFASVVGTFDVLWHELLFRLGLITA